MWQEEVEMEDVTVEEPILDIDLSDAKNSLAAVEYVQDLYSFYRTMEVKTFVYFESARGLSFAWKTIIGLNLQRCSCVPADYMMQQMDLNEKMRAILIDWLIEVLLHFSRMMLLYKWERLKKLKWISTRCMTSLIWWRRHCFWRWIW